MQKIRAPSNDLKMSWSEFIYKFLVIMYIHYKTKKLKYFFCQKLISDFTI